MANLSITTECHRTCGYCFARGAWNGAARHMTLEEYGGMLDFLARSGIDQARLLGGEPTLHPEFGRMVEMALERGLRVLVFTSGMMPEAALETLAAGPADRVAVLINVSAEAGELPLGRLGERVTLGMNIQSAAFEAGPLLELIREHGLSPTIRFGLAHPCVDGSNRFLHPRHYRAVGERLARFAERARECGVGIELDCGFVPCMFPEQARELLGPGAGCGPVPDILPDGTVVACYPLAAVSRGQMEEGGDAAGWRQRFENALRACRSTGVLRACSGCAWREAGQCQGGCLAAVMLRLRSRPFSISVPEGKVS